VLDLHAHILPALDDGPRAPEDALAMARAAAAAGTRAIATTSHVNVGFGLGPADLATARADLAALLRDEGVELELLAGGEIAARRLPSLADETLAGLTLGGGPYVLLECPLSNAAIDMDALVADLHARGFGVLLAHPERSPAFQREPERLERLVAAGALAQVTAGALTGGFGETARAVALTMLDRGLVHVLASDAHDAVHRPPDLRVADDVLGETQREWMAEAAPAAIVAGEPLPERPVFRPAWSAR
jgi:protein-tyrosine phosphatase